MRAYLNIAKVYTKFHIFPHVLVALLFCLISPLIMGIKNLDLYQTAKLLETYVALLGVILLIPLFFPDQDKDILDLIRSKKQPMLAIYFIRFLVSVIFLVTFIAIFLIVLERNHCSFEMGKYFYGTFASTIFLGGLGIFIYGIFSNLAISYMVPIIYYIMCYGVGKKYLGKFYLFSMLTGSVKDKWVLLLTGIVLCVAGILLRNSIVKRC